MNQVVFGKGLLAMLCAAVFLVAGCAAQSHVVTHSSDDAGAMMDHASHDHMDHASHHPIDVNDIEANVQAVLDAQVEAWNAGDIRSFMRGYDRADSLVVISDGNMTRGWQTNLYAYVRNFPNQASMGTLSIENVDVEPLAHDAALVYGMYRVIHEGEESLGLFSLVFRDTQRGWRIIHDHTSSSP